VHTIEQMMLQVAVPLLWQRYCWVTSRKMPAKWRRRYWVWIKHCWRPNVSNSSSTTRPMTTRLYTTADVRLFCFVFVGLV